MSRPPKPKKVSFEPSVVYFKPRAVPLSTIEEINLNIAELEAVRLCDLQELGQLKAAQEMKISQSTLSRILTSAHKKIADALINGKAIEIHKEIMPGANDKKILT